MEAQAVRTTAGTRERRQAGAARITLLLVLGAETIFFGTLLSSFLFMRAGTPSAAPALGRGGILLPAANTALLLVSALSAAWSERAIRRGQAGRLKAGLRVTFLLGLVFVTGQALEFTRSGLRPTDAALAGMVFALITFHALHVLAGMLVLALNLLRAHLGDFTARRYMPVQVGGWFWYYVTAVWVVLFAALYLV